MGGRSPEHEISLISGREVVRHLDKTKYSVRPVIVSRDGKVWRKTSANHLLTLPDPLKFKGSKKEYLSSKENRIEIHDLARMSDVVFIAMHGPNGEDGVIQGMLEMAGIPFTGSGVLASTIGMDKLIFRKILKVEEIVIPKYLTIKRKEQIAKILKNNLKLPLFVKPTDQGSSVGVSLVTTKKQLGPAIKKALKYSEVVLVDEFVEGIEVTCGVLGNDSPSALPLVEIIPIMGEFFDYDSKYLKGGTNEIVPARVSSNVTKKVQEIAVRVHLLLGCKGFSRVDFILRNNKAPVVLEINTIPGLTPTSLFPKAAKAMNISYSQLISKVINYSL